MEHGGRRCVRIGEPAFSYPLYGNPCMKRLPFGHSKVLFSQSDRVTLPTSCILIDEP